MGSGLITDPFQYDIRRRYHDDLSRISVKRILAGHHGFSPYTPVSPFNELAMLVIGSGRVFALGSDIGYDDPHKSDINPCLVDQLHRGKETVDEIGAFHQNLILPAPEASGL